MWEKMFCICLLFVAVDDLGFDSSVRLLGEVMSMHCPTTRQVD